MKSVRVARVLAKVTKPVPDEGAYTANRRTTVDEQVVAAARAVPARDEKPPLAVDLDGTLIRTDLFVEALLRFLFRSPWRFWELALWFAKGRAYVKSRLADISPCDPASLPFDDRVVAWLQEENENGRTVVLATASNRREAERVAAHLGFFSAVFASDADTNLKSQRKADALQAAYPEGFVYAGNESADLKVWAKATGAVLVSVPPAVGRQAHASAVVEKSFPAHGGKLRAFIKAIRPQQWAKNVLVFLPMLVGQGWSDPVSWFQAFIAFWALSFTASSVYLINDASDIDADRRHHRKRTRPFASGALSPVIGVGASFVFLGIGLYLGYSAGVLGLLLVYLVSTTLYTFWLKQVVLIDVFLLASLYTLRVILGGQATGDPASDWLLAFSCFFFLNLALAKRAAEVDALRARSGGELSRRSYFSTDGAMLKMMGVSAGFVSALVLALYLQDDSITARYNEPFLLWGLPAAVVFWVCRVWLMADRGEMHDDPLVFAFRDRTSWAVAAFGGACMIGAMLMPPGVLPF